MASRERTTVANDPNGDKEGEKEGLREAERKRQRLARARRLLQEKKEQQQQEEQGKQESVGRGGGNDDPKDKNQAQNDGEDPLDQFMEAQVNPEVEKKQREEEQMAWKERIERAKEFERAKKEGYDPRDTQASIVEEEDPDDKPDEEVEIPEKVRGSSFLLFFFFFLVLCFHPLKQFLQ